MKIRVIPNESLEAFAREQYRQHYAKAPEPRIVNDDALVAFACSTSRVVEWRSVRYHAPPLTFPAAVRLLAMANGLRRMLDKDAPDIVLERASLLIARELYGLLKPIRRRLSRRNQFVGTPASVMLVVLDSLLHVPDDGSRQPPSRQRITIDLVDNLATFARELPTWCGPDGLPLSWAHYVYGMSHIARDAARKDVRLAAAVRTGHWADEDGWTKYEAQQFNAAGW